MNRLQTALIVIVVVVVIVIAIYAMQPPPTYITFQGAVTVAEGNVPTQMTFYGTTGSLFYANLTGSGNSAAYIVTLPNFVTYSVTVYWTGPQGTGSSSLGVVVANSDILHSTVIYYNFTVPQGP